MSRDPGDPVVAIVGRELELASVRDPPLGERNVRAVVLVGEPGIGKTTLWDEGVAAARSRGVQVLIARPSESEARLPFAGLIDLCQQLGSEELRAVPSPQRRALEAAILRVDPIDGHGHPGAVEYGFVTALRTLAARAPVLIAVDDLQWLDRSSEDVVAFAARRLADARVGFLLARRRTRVTELERALERGSPVRIDLRPLTLGALRRILRERLGLTLSRPLLRRVVEVTQGNPLFALEIGRSFVDRHVAAGGDAIPLPDTVEEMLGGRVAQLPAAVGTALLAVSLSEDLRPAVLSAVAGVDAVDAAVQAGVLMLDGDRIRAAHPLLPAVARKRSSVRERRELHRALAEAVSEEPLRVLHLALAGTGPDEKLAARLAASSLEASARGERQRAVELAAHALRLTPAGAVTRGERVLALATCLYEAGELRRLTELLSHELERLPAGPTRARARLLLGEGAGLRSLDEADDQLELALAETGEDRGLRAYLLAKRAANAAAGSVSRMRDAEAWALEALRDADQPEVERVALYALAWTRALTGQSVDELCARSAVESDVGAYLASSPERVAGQRQIWRGELAQAREVLGRLLELADERGEEASYVLVHLHICELELRSGRWFAATRLLDEWAETSNRRLTFRPQYERCRALLVAGRGDVAEAERWAEDATQRAQQSGSRWDELEARRARGMIALVAGTPERAVEELGRVWQHTRSEGILEPGAFPVAPDLVEALVELERFAEARALTDRLARLARSQEHPWALASLKRSRALLRPGSDQAAAKLRAAAAELERLGMRLDAARSLLALGRMQRRAKQWRAARDALADAAAAFDRLGSPGWAELARAEQERVPGRRRGASGELTPTERRVMDLAASGLANKQIAATLFVSVHTVEVHLGRVYAKLGVSSRTQLAARLATPEPLVATASSTAAKD
ncbi:MAG TPA: AAA family ATPase [Solirubrobacteraceae bacterium]|nr:AAA family ATPase [Solirubrobacteraceae bacterium]